MSSTPLPKDATSTYQNNRKSSIATSRSSGSPLPASPIGFRANLDEILGDLTSSPSTSSTPKTLSSPLPPSQSNNDGSIDEDNRPREYSSEDGKEDELQYGETQFDYGDEASDGYEDEDKSMTSSEDEDVQAGKEGKEVRVGKAAPGDRERNVAKKAITTRPSTGLTNNNVVYHSTSPRQHGSSTHEIVPGDTMEDVLNTSYMTGRTTSYQWTSGVSLGNGFVSMDEQERRNILRTQINKELTEKWEQQQHLPQAYAEQDRYVSDATPEWEPLGDAQTSSLSDEDEVDVLAVNSGREESKHDTKAMGTTSIRPKQTIVAAPATPVPRGGKENAVSSSPSKRRRRTSSPDELEEITQEALLHDLDPEEQAELQELEKYREDDLAPLDDSIECSDDDFGFVDGGTTVKDAYNLYLRERSRSTSLGNSTLHVEIEEEEGGEDEPEPEDLAAMTLLSSEVSHASSPLPSPLENLSGSDLTMREGSSDSGDDAEDSTEQITSSRQFRRSPVGSVFSAVVCSAVAVLFALFVEYFVQWAIWLMRIYK